MSSKKASQDALSDLHAALATELAKRIREGTATAADLAVAKSFLKDNGINADLKPGSPLASVLDAAEADTPFDEDEEIDRQKSIFSGAPRGSA